MVIVVLDLFVDLESVGLEGNFRLDTEVQILELFGNAVTMVLRSIIDDELLGRDKTEVIDEELRDTQRILRIGRNSS